jgi:hypothetical protein
MFISSYSRAVFSVVLAIIPSISAQLNELAPCISQCIDQSTDDSCSIFDIKCICRESNGRFLPDLITCIHGACDNSISVDTLLTPLDLMCQLAGTPLSTSALENAEALGSSLAHEVTKTVTAETTDVITTTLTITDGGTTFILGYPITVWNSAWGPAFTITQNPPPATVTQTQNSETSTFVATSVDSSRASATVVSTSIASNSEDNNSDTLLQSTSQSLSLKGDATTAGGAIEASQTSTTPTTTPTPAQPGFNNGNGNAAPFSGAVRNRANGGLVLSLVAIVVGLLF